MKLVGVAAFLLILFICFCALYLIYQRITERKEWSISQEENHIGKEFWLTKGKEAHFVGRARRTASDYSDKLLELESEAEDLMNDWNSAERVARRKS